MVVGWLLYSNIERASSPYLTVAQLLAGEPSDRIVRAMGVVVPESIDWDPQQMLLQFVIADEGGSLLVHHNGVRPDLLEDGSQAVVEGRYQTNGVFEATSIFLKCPSKYAEK